MRGESKVQNIIDKLNLEGFGGTRQSQPPFFVGELVLAIDAIADIHGNYIIKNNKIYTVYSVTHMLRTDGFFHWFIGVYGNGIRTHDSVRPSIFRSLTPAEKQPLVLKLLYGD